MNKKVLLLLITAVLVFALAACNTEKVPFDQNLLKNERFEEYERLSNNERRYEEWSSFSTATSQSFNPFSFAKGPSGTGDYVKINNPYNAAYSYFGQKVAVEKGETYKISGYIRVITAFSGQTSANKGAYLGIVEDLRANRTHLTAKSSGTDLDVNGWTYYEVYIVNKDFNEITVAAICGSESILSTGEACFRNISFEKLSAEKIAAIPANAELFTISKANRVTGSNTAGSLYLWLFGLLTVLLCGYAYYLIRAQLKAEESGDLKAKKGMPELAVFAIILVSAFAIRFAVEFIIVGYGGMKDTGDLALDLANGTWSGIYGLNGLNYSDLNYTPGYLYILYIIGQIAAWLNGLPNLNLTFAAGSSGMAILLKIPSVIADIIAVSVIYNLAYKSAKPKYASIFAFVYALLPAAFTAVAGWGVDTSIMTLFILLSLAATLDKKYVASVAYFALAVIFGAKALWILPVMIAYWSYAMYKYPESRAKIGFTFLIGLVVFFVLPLPFTWDYMSTRFFYIFGEYRRLIKTYSGALPPYPIIGVATENAFNFYGILQGGNSLRYYSNTQAVISILIQLAALIAAIIFYFKKKNRAELFLLAAYIIIVFSVFCVQAQPFTIVMALSFLLIYVVLSHERRVFLIFGAYSLLSFINMTYILNISGFIGRVNDPAAMGFMYDFGYISMSVITTLLTIYFIYVVYDITYKNNLRLFMPLGDNSDDDFITASVKSIITKK